MAGSDIYDPGIKPDTTGGHFKIKSDYLDDVNHCTPNLRGAAWDKAYQRLVDANCMHPERWLGRRP